MEAKERGWYVYGRGAAAMEVGSSRGVQSGGDVRVWLEQRRGHGGSAAPVDLEEMTLGGLMVGSGEKIVGRELFGG
jgi:hypothetical protein